MTAPELLAYLTRPRSGFEMNLVSLSGEFRRAEFTGLDVKTGIASATVTRADSFHNSADVFFRGSCAEFVERFGAPEPTIF